MFFNGSSFTFIYSRKFVEKAKQICGRSQFFPECVHEVCGPSLQLLTLSPNTRSTRDVFSRTRQLTVFRESKREILSVYRTGTVPIPFKTSHPIYKKNNTTHICGNAVIITRIIINIRLCGCVQVLCTKNLARSSLS